MIWVNTRLYIKILSRILIIMISSREAMKCDNAIDSASSSFG